MRDGFAGKSRRKAGGCPFPTFSPGPTGLLPSPCPNDLIPVFLQPLCRKARNVFRMTMKPFMGFGSAREKGLQGNMQGEIPLSPPTLVTLHELLKFGTLESLTQAIRSRSWGDPRQPIQMKSDREVVIVQPWDPQYEKPIEIDPEGLPQKVIPAGEPFSRLWLDQGIWRPVRA